MKFSKNMIGLMTLLLTLAVGRFALSEWRSQPPFGFSVETHQGREELAFWQRGDGQRFVFLPSWTQMSEVSLESRGHVYFGSQKLRDGDSCGSLRLEEAYPSGTTTVTFLRSENLPALFLDTASGSMEHIHQDKENREGGSLRLYDAQGRLMFRGQVETIKGRGHSSFLYQQKKPYSLTLTAPADLLGMGQGEKWVLLADAYDPSHLRNKLVYDFAGELGMAYTPACRWVDVYLNGSYAGLYLLAEKNEIHPNRVDIDQEGGFLVSLDRGWTTDDPVVGTKGGWSVRIHQSGLPQQQIQSQWQQVEDAIRTQDPRLYDWIDLDSWARKYLIEEVFSNTDGGRFSQFFYRDGKDPSGKIYAGPVWDYDLGLSNPATYREFGDIGYRDSRYNLFYANASPNSVFYSLYQIPSFRAKVEQLYTWEFEPLLKQLPQKAQAYAEAISAAAEMDSLRWGTEPPAEQMAQIQDFLVGRREFLSSVWQDNRPYLSVSARYVDRTMVYYVNPGETLSQLPQYPGYCWYHSGGDVPVDLNAEVWEGMDIYLGQAQ